MKLSNAYQSLFIDHHSQLGFASGVGFGFRKAHDFSAILPLSALLQKLDPLEAFQDIALSGDRAGSSQTTML